MNSSNKLELKVENPKFIFLEKIKEMFLTIIEKEKAINDIKISLSKSSSSNIMTYFNEIDTNIKGYIDLIDLKKYLNKYSLSFKEHTVRRFIHQYDKHQKFSLIYEDFCAIFKPYIEEYSNSKDQSSNISSHDIFLKILKDTLELIDQINNMTGEIRKADNFTSYEAFMGITKGKKYLDEEFLNNFLDNKCNKNEIKHLIYLIDLNNDFLISYEEFQDFIIPNIMNEKEIDYKYEINDDTKYKKINDNKIVDYEIGSRSRRYYYNDDRKEKEGNRGWSCGENLNYKNPNDKYANKENISFNKTINFDPWSGFNSKSYNNYKDYNEYIGKSHNNIKNCIKKENNSISYKYFPNKNKLKNEKAIYEIYNKNNFSNNYTKNIFCEICNSEDDDTDEYTNFYRQTKKILSPSRSNNDIIVDDKSVNSLQKVPVLINKEENFNKNRINNLKLLNNKQNYNVYNCPRDYNINIIDKNNNYRNDNLNIIHSEIQYLSNNNSYNNINNICNKKYDYNNILLDNNLINMNEFTCKKREESEKSNITPRYNIIESLSLSNESNKFPKNENRINIHKISTRNADENDIIEVIDDEVNPKNTNRTLKYYNGSSISEFIRYIHFLLRKEKDTIDIKDKLCLRGDVNLKDLFFIFDYNKKNNITKIEFKTVCKKIFGLYPTSDQISLVFKRYDKNKDGNLNLREFLGMIKPLKEEYASFLFNDKKSRKENRGGVYHDLSSKSKKLLVEVVRGVIEDEGNYYKYKDDMINQNSFDLNELWDIMLRYSSNPKGLDTFELRKLLLDNGYSLSQYELNIIYNKMDYDDDQIISFEDLTQEFANYYKI